jgi:hypothetical protein
VSETKVKPYVIHLLGGFLSNFIKIFAASAPTSHRTPTFIQIIISIAFVQLSALRTPAEFPVICLTMQFLRSLLHFISLAFAVSIPLPKIKTL